MSHTTVQDAISVSSIDKSVPIHKLDLTDLTSASHSEGIPAIIPPTPDEELAWSKVRTIWQDAFSEFLGTMTLILFGDGVVAQVVLSGGEKGNYQSISWGWG